MKEKTADGIFQAKYIENLEFELKRLKKENKNTIKLQCAYNDAIYEIDTQFSEKHKDGDILYLADDYKRPSKLKFVKYVLKKTVNSDFILFCEVLNLKKYEFEYYHEKSLFKSKDKASDKFLEKKFGGVLSERK